MKLSGNPVNYTSFTSTPVQECFCHPLSEILPLNPFLQVNRSNPAGGNMVAADGREQRCQCHCAARQAVPQQEAAPQYDIQETEMGRLRMAFGYVQEDLMEVVERCDVSFPSSLSVPVKSEDQIKNSGFFASQTPLSKVGESHPVWFSSPIQLMIMSQG